MDLKLYCFEWNIMHFKWPSMIMMIMMMMVMLRKENLGTRFIISINFRFFFPDSPPDCSTYTPHRVVLIVWEIVNNIHSATGESLYYICTMFNFEIQFTYLRIYIHLNICIETVLDMMSRALSLRRETCEIFFIFL